MKITTELLTKGRSGSGGWNKKQIALLGLDWPPRRGWQKRIIGKEITAEDAQLFIELQGITAKRHIPSMFN